MVRGSGWCRREGGVGVMFKGSGWCRREGGGGWSDV